MLVGDNSQKIEHHEDRDHDFNIITIKLSSRYDITSILKRIKKIHFFWFIIMLIVKKF
jgi:hypothetical protein